PQRRAPRHPGAARRPRGRAARAGAAAGARARAAPRPRRRLMRITKAPERPRVLLAAFEPFGGRTVNQSERLARALVDTPPRGIDVDLVILPVAFRELQLRAGNLVYPRMVAAQARALVLLG